MARVKKTGPGVKPWKLLKARLFNLRQTPFDIKRAFKKGHVRSFAAKDRDPDPQDPLVARLPNNNAV